MLIAAVIIAALLLLIVLLQISLLRRTQSVDLSPLANQLDNLEKGQEKSERVLREEMAQSREITERQARALRTEVSATMTNLGESLMKSITQITTTQQSALQRLAEANQNASKQLREEIQGQMAQLAQLQKGQLDSFSAQLAKLIESNEKKFELLKAAVEQKLTQLQEDNAKKLDQMRATVDEKLQGTLERRLGESFKLVSERLEQVAKGLGEMQTLANGVGDLKKVLSNVKTRGTWGEMQLGNLLEQILTPEQYATNVQTNPATTERVEFAIKLPGRDDQDGKTVWLPIDAKFPKEDFERLIEASERADLVAMEVASKQLDMRLRSCARDIHDKYLCPPDTTDFALMFLPCEGLYAEALRRPGLVEQLQSQYRVVVSGPTTLAALLNSLQMGFRTLAIQKRSSEVWKVLGAVKSEFGKFGDIIEKVRTKLDSAQKEIDKVSTRTRAIQRSLKTVEELPAGQMEDFLSSAAEENGEAEEEPLELAGEEVS